MIRALPLFLCLSIASCRATPPDEGSSRLFDKLLLSSITEQEVQERSWRNVSPRQLFTLPRSPNILLFNTGSIKVDVAGNIFVADLAALKVLAFDHNGQYIASYGEGEGEGPGELRSVMHIGLAGDTTLFIVDYASRKISYFSKDSGAFIESQTIEGTPIRHTVSAGGVEYTMIGRTDSLFRSQRESHVTPFAELVENQISHGFNMALGFIDTYRDEMLLSLTYFPVIARYSPDGSLIYARTTPDFYAQFEEPEWVRTDFAGGISYRIDGEPINYEGSVYNDQLFLHSRREGAIDVFDPETGNYEYSFRLPRNEPVTYVMNDRLYQAGDTTVSVYSLDL